MGVTDTEEEINIPLNSPHKVHVFVDRCLEDCNTSEKACSIFPSKYKHIRVQNSQEDPTKGTGEKLEVLYFDRDTMELICLDNQGCEVALGLNQLNGLIVTENYKEAIIVAEISAKKITPPFNVQFIERESSSEYLPKSVIRIKKIVSKQTVIATSRDGDSQSILTFPSTIDVTVLAPQEASGSHPGYRNLCETMNREMNLKKVKETMDNYAGVSFITIFILVYFSCL